MMANTVSRYSYGLMVNSQYLGITVWTVYCPLLIGGWADIPAIDIVVYYK